MGKRGDGLAGWESLDVMAAQARVAAHPEFPGAVVAMMAGMAGLAEHDRAVDSIFKDAGRYVATMCAFWLHETTGLTRTALKAVCAGSGLLSPGRARALIDVLQHLGYVARGDGGRYALTPAFLSAWDAHLRAALAAAARIEPGVGAVLADGRARRAFGRLHAGALLKLTPGGLDPVVAPIAATLMHPHAGNQILWTLVLGAEGGTFPPVRTGPITLSALARRFRVSRVHVRRIFEGVEREGLGRLASDGTFSFTPAAREQLAYLHALQLVAILKAAAAAAAESGLVRGGTAAADRGQNCPVEAARTDA